MLQKLLERISKGGLISTTSLAQELGVSPALVEAMLADLTRAGYLRTVEAGGSGCGSGECGGCGSSATCHPSGRKSWVLVDRAHPAS